MNKYNFQVGDFCLKPTWDRERKEIGKITKVDDDGEIYIDRWYDESCIEPIPITDEWLTLNNFFLDEKLNVYREDIDYQYWKNKDGRLTVNTLSNTIYEGYSSEVRMYKAHLDNDHYETIGSLDVQYTHQIQHLCRDCQYEFKPKFK